MADKFNIYFTSIAQSLSANIPSSNKSFLDYMKSSLEGSFVLNPTTPHELISLSQSLKPTHSSGPDDIDPCVASSVVDLFSTPLALIINSSFTTGIVPSAIKQARATQILKNGAKTEMSNYRPISILPYFSKLFGSHVRHADYTITSIKWEYYTPTSMDFKPRLRYTTSLLKGEAVLGRKRNALNEKVGS